MKNIFSCCCWLKRYFFDPIEIDRRLSYFVQRGDTVKSIAKILHMSEEEIINAAGEKGFRVVEYDNGSGGIYKYKMLIPGTQLFFENRFKV